ncbi:hypothetical protein BDD12DRAFT_760479, partial [Trichophaea hybrida]
LACFLLSCVYSGCHATAWNSHFPSFVERWIWKGCCIVIVVQIPLLYGIMVLL